jgi:prepilin-type N-terminal cleavage/methylation domain-containing protein
MRVARGERDGGFTVIELSIAMVIGAVVFVAVTGIMVSQFRAGKDVDSFTTNQEDIRQALIAIQQDLRSAEPLTEVANPLDLQYRVDLMVFDSVSAATPVQIRWRLDSATRQLLRESVDANNNVLATSYRLKGVANADTSIPLFSYYKADDTEYVLSAPGTTPGTIAFCTVRMRVDIRAAPHGGRKNVQLTSDVQLRNRLPGAEECPN